MTAFVESCVEAVADTAARVQRATRDRPRATKLLRLLKDKRDILVTCHMHPDPDALASAMGMRTLLKAKLPDARVTLSIKGHIGGGVNAAFTRYASIDLKPWDDARVATHDAIVLVDVQPAFPYSPLPKGIEPVAVIDHHRARVRRPKCLFCDIRPDVGATASIVFAYFMELDVEVPADLAAALLFAIESDLAGAAGQPDELDTIALSNLTLVADPRKLYRMRHVDLPQRYFDAYADGIANAVQYGPLLVSRLDPIESLEMPAVIADFLLRYDRIDWVLVAAAHESRLVLSLRTKHLDLSAGEAMRKIVREIGQGGGHRTKAGGFVPLANDVGGSVSDEAAIERLSGRILTRLRRRLLRAIGQPIETRGQPLIPPRPADIVRSRGSRVHPAIPAGASMASPPLDPSDPHTTVAIVAAVPGP